MRFKSLDAFELAWRDELADGRRLWHDALLAHGLDEIAITKVLELLDAIDTRRMTEVLEAMAAAIANDDGVTTLPHNHGIDEARQRQELEAFTEFLAHEAGAPRSVH